MANKRNYQRELDMLLSKLQDSDVERANQKKVCKISDHSGAYHAPTLLLHSCCAPCSSYVLEYLSQYFEITVLYYNPNIYPEEEYHKRVREQRGLIERMETVYPVHLTEGRFDTKEFYDAVRGLEHIHEGGERCHACFRLRLGEAARVAAEEDFDYFTTTLTISPLKNAEKLNEIGEELADTYQIRWLPSDFKKKNGYRRSVELSAEYGLYRQDYCGCVFSLRERQGQGTRAPEPGT